MDDRFFEAWITRSDWKVCGLRLQPLCLGHTVNLAAVGSPLAPGIELSGDLQISPADLLVAARICAEGFPHPGHIRPRLRDVLWRIRLERDPALFRREALVFAGYREDHTSAPQFWEDATGDGRAITAPVALSKAAYLLAETSIPEPRVWSMPLGRVDYLIGAIEERKNGQLTFLYDDDLEAPGPVEEEMSEAEILAFAKEQLGPERFAEWAAARKANQ